MYKVSELLGKPVISLDGDMLGTIGNIYFDPKVAKAAFVKLYTEDDECVFLPMSRLTSLENDAAVASSADFDPEPQAVESPVNLSAFDHNGNSLGTVRDIIMNGAKVVSFSVGETEIPCGRLISTGKVAVFNSADKPMRVKTRKRAKSTDDREVELPAKTYAPSYDFLLGRRLQRNILTRDGKVIAREGENVTDAMIESAKKEGKLVVLALNAQ